MEIVLPTRQNGLVRSEELHSGYTPEVRKLYCPLQPGITAKDKHVTYCEFFPDPSVQPYIYCYWQLKTSQPLQHPFSYRVVADGCIDIFFEMNHLDEGFVMGFCRKFTEFPLDAEFNYVGVRFLPAMFPRLFDIDASDLSNSYHPLDSVIPDTARFISDHLNPEDTMDHVLRVFDLYFIDQFSRVSHITDKRFFQALQYILARQGVLSIESDIDTGLSSRQMRRLFNFYVGDSPKIFAKVVRFQNILRAKPSLQSLRENKLFYDAGYYDQAHFIKEFRNFYGVTPSKAFGRQE